MKIQLLLCMLVVIQIVYAQKVPDVLPTTNPQTIIAALKSNPDIVWMGEVMVDYRDNNGVLPQNSRPQKYASRVNKEQLLKYQSTNRVANQTPKRISDILLGYAKRGDVHATVALKTRLEGNSLLNAQRYIDTLIVFNPETFEEMVEVVVRDYTAEQVPAFRVRQLVYFDKKEGAFLTKPLAIAPLIKRGSNFSPLFWVAANVVEDFDLNDKHITLVKRLYAEVNLTTIKILKSKKSQDEAFELFATYIGDSKNNPYLTHKLEEEGVLALNRVERAGILSSVDTIITFDPETFEEIVQVLSYSYSGKDTEKIQLIEDWSFDSKTNKIQITPLGIGILSPRDNTWEDCVVDFINITNPSFVKAIRATMRTE